LTEPQVIRELYKASRAGVKIDLIIRGICCLRPGVPDLSENIQVRSIVGRFLEHSRVFYFLNDEFQCYFASADWMSRNLFRRVEQCVPVEDPELAQRLYHECFQLYLDDTVQTWVLNSDGSYERLEPDRDALNAQRTLLEMYALKELPPA
jgi:polyphosphate kinase